ncbi:MAG TPA: glucosamine-6-phosphate deaminase [Bacteroidota bacterium]|nr:glucosamine-6-phosphate deaminase [Bacteroidota bacterium]
MNPRIYDGRSVVEETVLGRGPHRSLYPPTEKIPVIEVANFPSLGRLAALRFIEWILRNPGGVIALPTGRTPEYFIKWVRHILGGWSVPEVRAMLGDHGIESARPPDMRALSFVQIDEFYPIDPRQHNSFHHYVNEFYIAGFGLDPARALLIDTSSIGNPPGKSVDGLFPGGAVDLSLRTRHLRDETEKVQKDVINRVDEFCTEYESRIRELGGIGFFLGGIGPDGHLAFNVRGSSFYSVTRLTQTNYETQAAAATDLGGMEVSRNRLVITIGLETITYNNTCTAIVIAAGEAKATVIARAVEGPKSPQSPASVLQGLDGARFYLTRGAASGLVERKFEDFASSGTPDPDTADEIIIGCALRERTPLRKISSADFTGDRFAALLVEKTGKSAAELGGAAADRMEEKIAAGLKHVSDTVFLHTEPHHDDIMLGYLAHIYHLVRDPGNVHYFANLTSGFTAVTNSYMLSRIRSLGRFSNDPEVVMKFSAGYFDPADMQSRMADIYLYLDGVAAADETMRERAEAYRFLRSLGEVYRVNDPEAISDGLAELEEYFLTTYPGAKDPAHIQTLKGTVREWEVELLWAYFGIEASSIRPLRLGFYTGDIFAPEPEADRDAGPIYEYIKNIRPGVVTVAFDPESSGPDTHYKALRAVAAALKRYAENDGGGDVRVWGYRNVWHRFSPAEANLFVPVSLNSLSLLLTAFMTCFGSQRAASFPSYDHDGPFSELARRIQVEQYVAAKACLGDDYFLKHDHPRLRAARGMIFLREMNLGEFFRKVRLLEEVNEIAPGSVK